MWNGLPIVVMGTSGISKEVKTIIDEINNNSYGNQFDFKGYIGEEAKSLGEEINGCKVVSYDEDFETFIKDFPLIGVVIPIGTSSIKEKIYNKLKGYKNLVFPNIISPRSNIMDINSISFGEGNIICAGVTMTCNITLGSFNLVNINSTIGHDTNIGDFCVINPLTSISGGVTIKSKVLLGAGSTIKQGITLEDSSTVGLGAFIVKDVKANTVMVCQTAKELT
jgi:sugar O-acyltransferase (sialic acid O-acetyltransferase NeuD family)